MKTVDTLPHAPVAIGLNLQLLIGFIRLPASSLLHPSTLILSKHNSYKILWVSSELPEILSMESEYRRQWEKEVEKCSGTFALSLKMRPRPWTDSQNSTSSKENWLTIWSVFYLNVCSNSSFVARYADKKGLLILTGNR